MKTKKQTIDFDIWDAIYNKSAAIESKIVQMADYEKRKEDIDTTEETEKPTADFATKFSIVGIPAGLIVDSIIYKPIVAFFLGIGASQGMLHTAALIIAAVVIVTDILLGMALRKAKKKARVTRQMGPVIYWTVCGCLFVSITALVTISIILSSRDFTTAHIVLFIAIIIFSTMVHAVILFNENFHNSLEYWFGMWGYKSKEWETHHNTTKYNHHKNSFKKLCNEYFALENIAREQGIDTTKMLSEEAKEQINKFYQKTNSGARHSGNGSERNLAELYNEN